MTIQDFKRWLGHHITKDSAFGDFARHAYTLPDFPLFADYQTLRAYVRDHFPAHSPYNKVLKIPIETFINLYLAYCFEFYIDYSTPLKDKQDQNFYA